MKRKGEVEMELERFGVMKGDCFWYVVDHFRGHRIVEVAGTRAAARKEAVELNQLEPCCGSCYYVEICEMERVVE